MAQHKIIFAGPVGAGKTTAISVISDIPIVSTDESASDMTLVRKPNTTVAMDYGLMKLDGQERVHLYGTPGQERFNFMWDDPDRGRFGAGFAARQYTRQSIQGHEFLRGCVSRVH